MTYLHSRKILAYKHIPILFLVLFGAVVGLFVVNDFGVGVDEPNLRIYGKESLDS
jgi:hypothetical protein